MRKLWRVLAGILGVTVALYAIASAALFAVMVQPPETFGAVMAKMPVVAMIVLPFEPLWMRARKGKLNQGDPAPDFSLPTLDHSKTVRLAAEARERPVVLVFGSYT